MPWSVQRSPPRVLRAGAAGALLACAAAYECTPREIVPCFAGGVLPDVGDGRLRIDLGDERRIHLVVREGRLGEALWIWRAGRPEDSTAWRWHLRAAAGRIAGFVARLDGAAAVVYELDAQVGASGAVAGSWRGAGRAGTASGGLEGWDALAAASAPLVAGEWPQWAGPAHDFQVPDRGVGLIDGYAQLRPLWRSEEASLAGIGSICRAATGCACASRHMAGGSASHVLADGRLHLSYFVPTGEPVAAQLAAYDKAGAFARWRTQPWGEQAVAYERRRWGSGADAIVVAIDVRNGRTLWRKAFRERRPTGRTTRAVPTT